MVGFSGRPHGTGPRHDNVQLGPRPYFLVEDMKDGELKDRLRACFDKKPRRTSFSIGRRGTGLQFPEHTKESYEAAYRMGAGIIECDVTLRRRSSCAGTRRTTSRRRRTF